MVTRRSRVVIAAACFYALFIGFSILHQTGQVGVTRKNGGVGCICHGALATDSVAVWISGPESVRVGRRYLYNVSISRGPAVAGGFNVAAGSGTLDVAEDSTHLQNSELTHSSPKMFQGDTVRWDFFYTPSPARSADTLFSAGNSVNRNDSPTGDQWNFGADFVVQIRPDTMLGVSEENRLRLFRLHQNYPNPFNPVTHVSFDLGHSIRVSLAVLDVLGRVVATLVDGRMAAGTHEVTWDGGTNPSGIYFCRLQAGARFEVRKMILLR